MMVVYGYARLVGYDDELQLVAGHPARASKRRGRPRLHASICAPATAGRTASRSPPRISATSGRTSPTTTSSRRSACRATLLVDGAGADASRCSTRPRCATPGTKPNPHVPAGARRHRRRSIIYRPAHYLKQFHAQIHRPDEARSAQVKEAGPRNWAGAAPPTKDKQYRNDNPDLPTLEPWINTTPPPSDALRLRAQSLLPPRRPGGPPAALHRPRDRATSPTAS